MNSKGEFLKRFVFYLDHVANFTQAIRSYQNLVENSSLYPENSLQYNHAFKALEELIHNPVEDLNGNKFKSAVFLNLFDLSLSSSLNRRGEQFYSHRDRVKTTSFFVPLQQSCLDTHNFTMHYTQHRSKTKQPKLSQISYGIAGKENQLIQLA